ncbi:MAG: PQQ-like beta-propeller repeat protein [Gemmataceae bacterium]|nr:PQQ-like beta-propeller repeat protein [Gemmataceae bacterium]
MIAWGVVGQLRFDGLEGDFRPNISWRWVPSEEERFLAGVVKPDVGQQADKAVIAAAPGDWPEFRGSNRDSIVTGVSIDPDWTSHPPKLVWKKRVGPGWSSFAIVGDHIFTQEQRADQECVTCYSTGTGKELWEYRHPGRFEEAVSGVGPRSTPTFSDGRIYAMGAMGHVACLDAATGREIWSADVVKSLNGTIPQWGYSSSPLVVKGVCIAYVGGGEGKGLAGFDSLKGTLAWTAGNAVHSYSSPHRATLDGVEQVLLSSEVGVESVDPATGKLLWRHDWNIPGMNRVTQPAIVNGTDLLVGTGVGPEQGTRRLHVSKKEADWSAKPEWTSRAMKAYFNDGVVFGGHLYGFDTSRFVCVQLDNGKLIWKDGGRNGNGQVLLLTDQGLLIILAADGSLAISEATPRGPKELARIPALEGKTWNHPVFHGGRLYLRNPQEMACYELKMK